MEVYIYVRGGGSEEEEEEEGALRAFGCEF
jgi:hypothetical protein